MSDDGGPPSGERGGVGSANPLGVPGYEDLSVVGRGGFATVYRARQVSFNRLAAVKVLSGVRLDAAGIRRFERERAAMGTVSSHPNIVTVYEAGFTADGAPYLAMEFLPIGSLADRLERRGPMDWRKVLEIGVKLASALETAHRAGVLHRDVKPENVLWSGFGEPQLTDFGIARFAIGTQTSSGENSLTVAHAPPEVIAGRRPSVQSDVYSLASTLLTLLWGRSPFERDDDESIIALLVRIPVEPVPDLRKSGVPDQVCAVLERAMAKDPSVRQESAMELGEDLRSAQTALGLTRTPIPLVKESSREVWAVPQDPTPTPGPPVRQPAAAPLPPRALETLPAAGGSPLAPPVPEPVPPPVAPVYRPIDHSYRPPGPAGSETSRLVTPAPYEPPPAAPPPVRRPQRAPSPGYRSGRWQGVFLVLVLLIAGAAGVGVIVRNRTTTTTTATTATTSGSSTTITSVVPPPPPPPLPAPGPGPVAAGRYVTSVFHPAATLRFDPGWRVGAETTDLVELVRNDQPLQRVQIVRVQRVYRQQVLATIAQARSSVEPVPAALAEWLRTLPTTAATESRAVSRAGIAGRQVDVAFSGYAYEGCGPTPCVLLFQLEPLPGQPDTFPFVKAQGEKARFYVFDVGGDRVVVVISSPDEDFDSFVSTSERLLSVEKLGPA